MHICSACKGSGYHYCYRCGGYGTFEDGSICYYCQGSKEQTCGACNGTGWIDD